MLVPVATIPKIDSLGCTSTAPLLSIVRVESFAVPPIAAAVTVTLLVVGATMTVVACEHWGAQVVGPETQPP